LNKFYIDRPESFAPLFEAAGIFIQVGDEILLMHRHPDKPYGETWGIPAGKIEKGEKAIDAAIRELKEETGIAVPSLEEIGTLYVRLEMEGYDFSFHLFKVTLSTKPDVLHEPDAHIDWAWMKPTEAFSYPLIVGGKEMFEFYVAHLNT